MCLFSPFVLMSVFVVLCWKWRQICRSPTNQFEKNLFQIGSNLKKAYFKLVRIWKKPFSNWFVEMEFVSQIFRHNGLRTNRPYLSAEKSGRKIWGFPGTKIFPQKMFPQLDLRLTNRKCVCFQHLFWCRSLLFCVENDNKSGDHLRTNLKKDFFKLVRIWKKPFSNWFVEMEFVSQIFRRDGLRTNRPYLSPEKSFGRKIWGFPGTKIFPQKMFPQLDLSLMIILLLFLQKQNLAFSVYLFGSVLSPHTHTPD